MSTVDAAHLAAELRRQFLHKPFGIIKFWGFSVVPPNDQSYELVATHADGDRLDLVFVHESRSGLPGVISVFAPSGLEPAHAGLTGIIIRDAVRLRLDDAEATLEGDRYRLRTARGEGTFPLEGEPALVLAR